MTLWDWLIVLVLNGAIIGYGFYLSRKTTSGSEWFLAGRSLPWWGLGLSIVATAIDNADLVSVTGHVYNNGIHILTVFTIATALGCCLSAFLIVPWMYKLGCYTNAEFLEYRFGKSLRLFSALIQIQYRTAILGLMVWSFYLMLIGMVGLEPTMAWALIVLLVLLTAAYTVWGGLASVVWTDALQSLIIFAGSVCIFVSVWNAVGGWDGLREKLATLPDPQWVQEKGWVGSKEDAPPEGAESQQLENWIHMGEFVDPADNTHPFGIMLGWTIIGVGYYTVNHTQTMRLMGARSLWDMKMASIFGAALGIPLMLTVMLLGLFGRVLYPDFTAGDMKADALFPILANDFLTMGLKGLVMAGIVSATVSTFDSMGSALSALFTRDIYARWLRPGQSEAHYLKAGRIATIGVLMLGFLYIPYIISYRNMIDATQALVSVFVTPLFAIYLMGTLTSVPKQGGLVGLIVGGTFGMCCFLQRQDWLESLIGTELPEIMVNRWYVYVWSMGLTAGSMSLTYLFWKPQPVSELINDTVLHSELPPVLEHPFSKPVPVWLQPRWYALVLILFNVWFTFYFFW
ncbi:Sodium/glucose cotransporter [Polystyrenella longa]|uniref:Sodium/glucose cotransporter n=1 Tax=Polystyrenella longa TaxID=2528007 RepID=A0A518CJX6_9PLAN|nr:sodium/solute symporter [Polystyrenella longa]QDU79520.1 Sodium/glucose cotransporter [Polystyrenella longa]